MTALPFRLGTTLLPRTGTPGPEARSNAASLGAEHAPPRGIARRVDVAERRFADLTVFTLTPPEPLVARVAEGGPLLYLHGPLDAPDAHPVHWAFLARIAERTGRAVTVPLYPTASADGGADDALTLLRLFDELTASATDAAPVAVMGDAAGAQTARSLVDSAAAPGMPRAQLILLTTDTDTDAGAPSADAHAAEHHAHDAVVRGRRFVPESRQAIGQLVEALGPVKSLF